MTDVFKGIYFINSGIIQEKYGQQIVNKTIGEILGLRSLVSYMNSLINRHESSEGSPESLTYITTAEAIRESFVFFFDRNDLVEMAFSNEELFESIYKTYYQQFVMQTNVNLSDAGCEGHIGHPELKGSIPETKRSLRSAPR